MSEFDSKALSSAREVMALIRQEHIGGEAQLIAKIQLLFIEAMEYAAPQSFGNSEQLNSPAVPDGWRLAPEQATPEMLQAGIAAHYERSQAQIHDRPAPGPMECAYDAMLAAAPKQESE